MIVGNTWKATMDPKDECCLPSSPKTNDEPAKALLSIRVTPSPAAARARSPKVNFITRNAKTSCSPSPQSTVRQRIARRSVEKSHARMSMVSNPSTPVNLAKWGLLFLLRLT